MCFERRMSKFIFGMQEDKGTRDIKIFELEQWGWLEVPYSRMEKSVTGADSETEKKSSLTM